MVGYFIVLSNGVDSCHARHNLGRGKWTRFYGQSGSGEKMASQVRAWNPGTVLHCSKVLLTRAAATFFFGGWQNVGYNRDALVSGVFCRCMCVVGHVDLDCVPIICVVHLVVEWAVYCVCFEYGHNGRLGSELE